MKNVGPHHLLKEDGYEMVFRAFDANLIHYVFIKIKQMVALL